MGTYVGYVLVTLPVLRIVWKSVEPSATIDIRLFVGASRP